jgi:phosphatidylglycerophosphate synthase
MTVFTPANEVTLLRMLLIPAFVILVIYGQLGAALLVFMFAGGTDALDGLLARATGSASLAGEVLDAVADRYVELALFAGIALYLRADPLGLPLALAALCGSFMVSYSSAKAEALGRTPPRGSMRRTERLTLLLLGAGLCPLVGWGAPTRSSDLPLFIALGWLALGANASALSRSLWLVRELRLSPPPTAAEPGRDAQHSSAR